MNILAARAGAHGGALLSGLGDISTPDPFSVFAWREWFAQAGGTRSVAEIQQRLGGLPVFDPKNLTDADHANAHGINPAAKNLFFAGQFYPGDSSWSSLTLQGPNGISAADLVSPTSGEGFGYAVPSDRIYNPDADRPEGWKIQSQGLVSAAPEFATDYSTSPPTTKRTGKWKGGMIFIVQPIPVLAGVTPFFAFHGDGMEQLAAGATAPGTTTPSTSQIDQATYCANVYKPYVDTINNLDRNVWGNLYDTDIVDRGSGLTKIAALLSWMVRANNDPEGKRASCGLPYPEAQGWSENPLQNLSAPPRAGKGAPPVVQTPTPVTPPSLPPLTTLPPILTLPPTPGGVLTVLDPGAPVDIMPDDGGDIPAPLPAPNATSKTALLLAAALGAFFIFRKKR